MLAPFSSDALEALGHLLPVTYEPWTETRRLYDPQELAERINREQVGILLVEADFLLAELFEAVTTLRLVGICRNSLEHVELAAATRHGVPVVNAPSRNARAVAELTVSLLLALARSLVQAHTYVKGRHWEDPVGPYITMRGSELQGKTLGIIGLGGVGREVARLARRLGMRVLAYDPYVGPLGSKKAGATLETLETVLRQADFLSLHAPPTPETEGLLDARRLALLKPGAYLVNTASAALVEQEALAQALTSGHLAGAALDVHESHPLPPNSPLLELDNVILTPHLGGATRETVERYSWMMVEAVQRFLGGRRPRHLANPAAWRRRAR